MKVTVWIATNRIGSKCEEEIEVPDEDLEGLSDSERNDLIDEYGKDVIWNMAEWGWEEQ